MDQKKTGKILDKTLDRIMPEAYRGMMKARRGWQIALSLSDKEVYDKIMDVDNAGTTDQPIKKDAWGWITTRIDTFNKAMAEKYGEDLQNEVLRIPELKLQDWRWEGMYLSDEEGIIKPVYNNYDEIPEMKIEEATNFTIEEVKCKCGCGQAIVNGKLLYLLQQARTLAGVPFLISSWNRCEAHNKAKGGVKDSSHLKGCAVDLRIVTSTRRFLVVAALISVGMPRIKLYPTWIHADVDPDKIWRVIIL